RAHEHDAEAASALGDVEQDLLDRPGPFARRVLVELVEHDEHERPRRPEPLLLLEHALEDRAHHEAARPVLESVNIDAPHLLPLPIEQVSVALAYILAPDEMPDVSCRREESSLERSNRALRGGTCPLFGQAALMTDPPFCEHLDKIVERLEPPALDLDPRVARAALPQRSRELRLDAVHVERELAPLVVGLRD